MLRDFDSQAKVWSLITADRKQTEGHKKKGTCYE